MISPSRFYEESLYPMQDGVMNIIRQCGVRFYLTGGTALSRGYYSHRYSDDLDFFVNDDDDYAGQVKEVLARLKDNGFSWDTESDFISSESFTSLKVRWGRSDAMLKLDFVNDVSAHFGELSKTSVYYRTDSIRNMLANKLTAIFRFAAKDVADIREIAMRAEVIWAQAIHDARQKEVGIELYHVSSILSGMPKSEFDGIHWVRKPEWADFKADLDRIAFDMLNG